MVANILNEPRTSKYNFLSSAFLFTPINFLHNVSYLIQLRFRFNLIRFGKSYLVLAYKYTRSSVK